MILKIDTPYGTAIIAKKTLQDVRKTLKEMNRSHAVATQTKLLRKLLSLQKGDSQSIQEFRNLIANIENQLAASGYQLEFFDKRYALQVDFSGTYDTIKNYSTWEWRTVLWETSSEALN